MFISPLNISPLSKSGSAPFKINHSFLGDGVNNYFQIPNADLDPNIFGGTNNKYTIYALVKRGATGTHYIFENGTSFALAFSLNRVILISNNNAQSIVTSSTFTDLNSWYFIAVNVDLQDTATNSHIKVNNVTQPISANTLTATTPVATAKYNIFRRSNGTSLYDGNMPYLAVVNRLTTTQEDTDIYNGGKPINPNTYFGADCKMFLNTDNSTDTAQFSWTDTDNGHNITATSFNMVDADKTTTTPY